MKKNSVQDQHQIIPAENGHFLNMPFEYLVKKTQC